MRARKDDNGREFPGVTGVGEVGADRGRWVRVETEGLVFFIEERGGGGGRL